MEVVLVSWSAPCVNFSDSAQVCFCERLLVRSPQVSCSNRHRSVLDTGKKVNLFANNLQMLFERACEALWERNYSVFAVTFIGSSRVLTIINTDSAGRKINILDAQIANFSKTQPAEQSKENRSHEPRLINGINELSYIFAIEHFWKLSHKNTSLTRLRAPSRSVSPTAAFLCRSRFCMALIA